MYSATLVKDFGESIEARDAIVTVGNKKFIVNHAHEHRTQNAQMFTAFETLGLLELLVSEEGIHWTIDILLKRIENFCQSYGPVKIDALTTAIDAQSIDAQALASGSLGSPFNMAILSAMTGKPLGSITIVYENAAIVAHTSHADMHIIAHLGIVPKGDRLNIFHHSYTKPTDPDADRHHFSAVKSDVQAIPVPPNPNLTDFLERAAGVELKALFDKSRKDKNLGDLISGLKKMGFNTDTLLSDTNEFDRLSVFGKLWPAVLSRAMGCGLCDLPCYARAYKQPHVHDNVCWISDLSNGIDDPIPKALFINSRQGTTVTERYPSAQPVHTQCLADRASLREGSEFRKREAMVKEEMHQYDVNLRLIEANVITFLDSDDGKKLIEFQHEYHGVNNTSESHSGEEICMRIAAMKFVPSEVLTSDELVRWEMGKEARGDSMTAANALLGKWCGRMLKISVGYCGGCLCNFTFDYPSASQGVHMDHLLGYKTDEPAHLFKYRWIRVVLLEIETCRTICAGCHANHVGLLCHLPGVLANHENAVRAGLLPSL